MHILKKYPMVLALMLVLALGGTAVSAAALPQQSIAVRYMDTLPGNWSIESAQTPEKEYLRSLTTTAMYTVAEGELLPALAAMPEDVTAAYAGTYGIPAGAVRGYAFCITLEQDVFWQDGTPVTADDVLFSVHTLLESKTSALDYLWLANAQGYLNGWEKPAETVVPLQEAGFAAVSEAREAGYTRFYLDAANLWGLEAGWEDITDRHQIFDYAINPGADEMYITPAYIYAQYLAEGRSLAYFQGKYVGITADRADVLTREDVGILKTGTHEVVIISADPVTASTVAARLAPLCLLNRQLYGPEYAAAAAHYSSYGPYRVTAAGADEITLERNPHWRGDTTPYPADVIRCLPG